MNYLLFKSLHIISVVTWFAGLFYMPRLFVYFSEANEKNEPEKSILQTQFKIMQKRLWLGITIPSSIAVLFFGASLLKTYWPITDHPWLIAKLSFVAGLYIYFFFLHTIFKKQQKDIIAFSPMALRVINEISTIFLFAIVFLVVMKNVMGMIEGIAYLIGLIIILGFSIKIYKELRTRKI